MCTSQICLQASWVAKFGTQLPRMPMFVSISDIIITIDYNGLFLAVFFMTVSFKIHSNNI